MSEFRRSFLKWAGNKYTSLSHIINEFPNARRLIEPFAGSGVVFINTDYPEYLIAEGNKDLIDLFIHLQQEGQSFIADCEAYFCDANNTPEQYYLFRQQFNQETNTRQRAALFVYLNHHGYNGLCRYNFKGIYNVPFGRFTKPIFPRARMEFFYTRSQGIAFKHGDFRDTFASAEPGDLIYCDPPYVPIVEQSSNFSSYTAKQFGEAEQILLAEMSIEAANRGIGVVISNHDTQFTRHHYRLAKIRSFPVKRHISRNFAKRLMVQELVAIFQ